MQFQCIKLKIWMLRITLKVRVLLLLCWLLIDTDSLGALLSQASVAAITMLTLTLLMKVRRAELCLEYSLRPTGILLLKRL